MGNWPNKTKKKGARIGANVQHATLLRDADNSLKIWWVRAEILVRALAILLMITSSIDENTENYSVHQ